VGKEIHTHRGESALEKVFDAIHRLPAGAIQGSAVTGDTRVTS